MLGDWSYLFHIPLGDPGSRQQDPRWAWLRYKRRHLSWSTFSFMPPNRRCHFVTRRSGISTARSEIGKSAPGGYLKHCLIFLQRWSISWFNFFPRTWSRYAGRSGISTGWTCLRYPPGALWRLSAPRGYLCLRFELSVSPNPVPWVPSLSFNSRR